MGARDDVIEGQIIGRAAILALKLVPQEDVEAREGRIAGRLDIGLEADDAWQLHRKTRRADRMVILGNDVHAVKEDGLDRVLPGPQRQGVITQWPVVGIQDERRQGLGRNCNRQGTLLIDSASAFLY
eukprot:gene38402-51876_t